MFNRIIKANETIHHKIAIASLWIKNKSIQEDVSLLRIIFHDMEKLILIIILGDNLATKIHRKLAGHHIISSQKELAEAVLDWEVARITKPDKPLNARKTCLKYYAHLNTQVMQICDKWKI